MKTFLYYILGTIFSVTLLSCGNSELVRTDLKSITENPDAYKGKEVIITVHIKTLHEQPDPYNGKKIEVTGYVERDKWPDRYWGFSLKDEEGRSVRCYERNYETTASPLPVNAVRRAERVSDPISVIGHFENGMKVELSWILYEGTMINTNYKLPFNPRRDR